MARPLKTQDGDVIRCEGESGSCMALATDACPECGFTACADCFAGHACDADDEDPDER